MSWRVPLRGDDLGFSWAAEGPDSLTRRHLLIRYALPTSWCMCPLLWVSLTRTILTSPLCRGADFRHKEKTQLLIRSVKSSTGEIG